MTGGRREAGEPLIRGARLAALLLLLLALQLCQQCCHATSVASAGANAPQLKSNARHGYIRQPPEEARPAAAQRAPRPSPKYKFAWFAPFWSGTGYSSEALNFILSMVRAGSVNESDVWISHHGDNDRKEVRQAMEAFDRDQLSRLERNANKSHPSIIVCHSLPTNWMMASPLGWTGSSCPPDPREYAYVYTIGRTMFETDRLPASFVPRCNSMNEIWVPSDFSKEVFIASGVVASKLRVVPEGVNTTHMDPDRYEPMPMPQGELVFGVSADGLETADSGVNPDFPTHAASPSISVVTRTNDPTAQHVPPPPATSTAKPPATDFDSTVGDVIDAQGTSTSHSKEQATHASQGGQSQGGGGSVGVHKVAGGTPRPAHGVTGAHGPGRGAAAERPTKHTGGVLEQFLSHLRNPACSSGSKDKHCVSAAEAPEGKEEDKQESAPEPFRFLSSFKWEPRKGWDILLEAYLAEFTHEDNVELIIITKPFVGGSDYKRQMRAWAERAAFARWQRERENRPHPTQSQPQPQSQSQLQITQQLQQLQPQPQTTQQQVQIIEQQNQWYLQQARNEKQEIGSTPPAQSQAQTVGPQLHGVPGGLGPAPVNAAGSGPGAARTAGSTQGQTDSNLPHTQQPYTMASAPVTAPPPPEDKFVFNASRLPRLYVVHHHIADADLPRFYKAVDAFVLPSRGEGWGRPHVEAMAMGLPIIATNWSGITAYLDESVGYPLAIDGVVPADPAVWWFRGLNWAQPSVTHLRTLMRRVYENREEARQKGAKARQRMIERYGPEAIGRIMAAEYQRVHDLIPK